jgi:hypothetical protein
MITREIDDSGNSRPVIFDDIRTYSYPDGVTTEGSSVVNTVETAGCGCKTRIMHYWGQTERFALSYCANHFEDARIAELTRKYA